VLDGAGGEDAALFRTDIWDGVSTAPQLNVAVNGSIVTISTTDVGDLYRVDLGGELAMDSIGDTAQDASTALTAGNAVRSSFETSEDVDTFAVGVEAGQTYIIRGLDDFTNGEPAAPAVLNVGDEFGGYAGDWYTNWDDSGEYVEFTPEATGTVYVSVQSFQMTEGDYTLEVLPVGADTAGETVEVPSEYMAGVTVEDIAMLEEDFVVNTEHFEFTVGNDYGETSEVGIDQTDTGYDILVNGVKQDEVAVA